jgi:hypothetical protein
MTVSYEVKDTFSEKGLGLFTREFIAKGQCVWRPVHALLAHGSDSGSGKKMAAGSNVRIFSKDDAIKLLENPGVDKQEKLDFFRKSYGDVNLAHILGKPDEGVMFLPMDASQYTNHAVVSEANTGAWFHVFSDSKGIDITASFALRDIQAGEEIVEDYGDFEDTAWFVELATKHNAMPSYYEMKPHKAFTSTTLVPSDDELPPHYEGTHTDAAMEAAMVLCRLHEGTAPL